MRIYVGPKKLYHLPYSDPKASEFHIHAKVYVALLTSGFDIRGEVRTHQSFVRRSKQAIEKGKHHRPTARFDLVVFHDNKLLAIIEIKDTANHWIDNGSDSTPRQQARYCSFGVPVYLFWDLKYLPSLIRSLVTLIHTGNP